MRLQARVLAVGLAITCGVAAGPSPVAAQTIASQPIATTLPDPALATESSDVRGIFAGVIEDFRRLPSVETVAILSVGGLGAAVGHGYDDRVTRTMSASSGLHGFLGAGETLGGAKTQMAAALATYTLGRTSGNAKVTTLGADLIRAQIVTQTMTAAIKTTVRRMRPDGTRYSFPSGHSSTTFATATVLQRNLGWKVGVPAYGLATYVAASRVQSRRHFLSDVTFGAALGIVAGRTVTIGRGDARFAVGPAAAPGGAGVNFTWVGRR